MNDKINKMNRCFFAAIISMMTFCSTLYGDTLSFDLDIGGGYRQDSLNWNIAGYNHEPDVLSELEWKDIRSGVVAANVRVSTGSWYLRGFADYAKIFSGRNTDSDYGQSGREGLILQSHASADKGKLFDWSTALGKSYSIANGFIVICPLAGYSRHEQHLHIHDGELTVNTVDGNTGDIEGLDSRYTARWYGPWSGIDAFLQMAICRVGFTWEYHWAHYRGNGHWNLREDILNDFQHRANARGKVWKLFAQWCFSPCLSLGIEGSYQSWHSHSGTDETTILDPATSQPLKTHAHLNGVHWRSFAIQGMLALYF